MRYDFDFDPDSTRRRLTPAARETLDELVNTYRNRLLESVHDHTPAEVEVSAATLLRAAVDASGPESRPLDQIVRDAERSQRDQLILIVSATLSLAVAILVLLLGAAPIFGFESRPELPLAVALSISAIGLLAAYATLLVAFSNRARNRRRLREAENLYLQSRPIRRRTGVDGEGSTLTEDPYERTSVYLAGWRNVEELLYELEEATRIEQGGRRQALSSVILRLRSANVLSADVAEEATYALHLRNRLVHADGRSPYVTSSDMSRLVELVLALRAAQQDHVRRGTPQSGGER